MFQRSTFTQSLCAVDVTHSLSHQRTLDNWSGNGKWDVYVCRMPGSSVWRTRRRWHDCFVRVVLKLYAHAPQSRANLCSRWTIQTDRYCHRLNSSKTTTTLLSPINAVILELLNWHEKLLWAYTTTQYN